MENNKGSQNVGLFWGKRSGRVFPIKNERPLRSYGPVISSPTIVFLFRQKITFSILIWNSKKIGGHQPSWPTSSKSKHFSAIVPLTTYFTRTLFYLYNLFQGPIVLFTTYFKKTIHLTPLRSTHWRRHKLRLCSSRCSSLDLTYNVTFPITFFLINVWIVPSRSFFYRSFSSFPF